MPVSVRIVIVVMAVVMTMIVGLIMTVVMPVIVTVVMGMVVAVPVIVTMPVSMSGGCLCRRRLISAGRGAVHVAERNALLFRDAGARFEFR